MRSRLEKCYDFHWWGQGPDQSAYMPFALFRQFQEEVQERARKEISQSREAAGTASTGTAGTVSSGGGGAYASPTTMTMQGGRASSNGAPSGTRQAVIATPPDLQVILFCACCNTS